MPKPDDIAQGRALWRALLTEDTLNVEERDFSVALLERFCTLLGPSLIDNIVPGALAPDLVKQARLLAKLTANRQTQALEMLLGKGHDVIAMKGFATSRLYHRDATARVTGDLDLLASEGDIQDIVATLEGEGYSVTTDLPMPPWGFVSEASYLPMTSADELVDIDLHIHPDCYPLPLGLTTGEVFENARLVDVSDRAGRPIKVPSPEHMLLIALSNATKEKLGPQSVKSLLDCGRILASELGLDWTRFNEMTIKARLKEPSRVVFAVISHLRGEACHGPDGGPMLAASFKGAIQDLATGFASGFSFNRKLTREILLTAEPTVTLRRAKDRLIGLFWKRSGIPPGADISAGRSLN